MLNRVLHRIGSLDWRNLTLAALALILCAFAYQALFETRHYDLEHEIENLFFHNSASGPEIVLAVASWLVYRRWYRLTALPRRSAHALALGLLLPGTAIYAWATYTGAQDLLIPALMLDLLGCAALLWGARALRVLALPTASLLLGLRIPAAMLNEILWKLQIWTAELAGFALRAIGIPTAVTGDQILQPDQNFAIIETCAGLRSAESLTLLAFLMVDMFGRRGLHAALLLVAAPLVAFVVNGFRAVTLILNPHSDINEIHIAQGIAMLLVGLLILYGIDGGLEKLLARRRKPATRAARAAAPTTRAAAGFAAPLCAVAVFAAQLALLATLPRWQAPARGSLPYPDDQLPKEIDGWTSTALTTNVSYLGIVRFRGRVDREYERGGQTVRLFVGVGTHDARIANPFSPKTAFPDTGWWREESRPIALPLGGPEARISVVRYGTGNRRELVIDWREGTQGFADEVLRGAIALDNSAWGRPREGVSARISTPLGAVSPARRAAAEALLLDFYRAIRPELDRVGYPPSR